MTITREPGAGQLSASDRAVLDGVEEIVAQLFAIRAGIGQVIFGQDRVVEETLVTLLCGGHGLLVGVPGLAKTRLVETISRVMGLESRRVQFTPDLMPKDILGSEVLDTEADGRRAFRFVKGPVFCQLLMADEINRASPRTQSALLQAMQERQVSIAGARYDLPHPFHVLATQNPIEQEGTYPLPEAQLDRFLLEIDIDYPDPATERQILLATTGTADQTAPALAGPADLEKAQRLVRVLPVGESVLTAILALTRGARPASAALPEVERYVAWGPGPRAGQALMLAVRARALIEGRLAPSIDDVRALAAPVLKHRMALSYAARADGLTLPGLIGRLAERIG
ncbi:MAG: MoxR family ATPase [Alphaproteobacteria bacterium]|nr:MoxR family ATPase [Alphaproteobacteria bacterium]